jgi:tRNA G18 (ribose-2'-O)-methylase SpoU
MVPQFGPALVVACIDIHDPTNLGGILRNCAAFGVDGVLLSARCADPFSRRVLRVSMGTAFKLRIGKLSEPENELQQLRSEFDCRLFATVLADDAERLETIVNPERNVILIGNEGHGLPPHLVDCCDRRVTLQMELATDSLNAAAATAVFLYHFTRIGSSSPRAREDSAS